MNRLLLPPRIGMTLALCLGLALLGMQWAWQRPAASPPAADGAAAQAGLLRMTQALATRQQAALTQIGEHLRILGGLSLTTQSTHTCGRLLARQLDDLPGAANLVVLDGRGSVHCTALPLRNLSPQDFSSALAAQRASRPSVRAGQLLLAAPLQSTTAHAAGHVFAVVPLAGWLRNSTLPLPEDVSLTLLEQTGQVLVTDAREPAWADKPPNRIQTGGMTFWQAAAPLDGAGHKLTLVARQAAPRALLETASVLPGLMGMILLAFALWTAANLAGPRLKPWWHAVAQQFGGLSARCLQRLRQLPAPRADSTVMLLRRSNVDLKRSLAAQESRNRQLQRLDQLHQMLQSSATLREAASAVAQCAHDLLPHSGGALLLRTRPGVVEAAVTWGHARQHEYSRPEDCWAQRLGQTYVVAQPPRAVCCTHLATSAPGPYVCVPLIAQGELLGTLHLQAAASSAEAPCSWLAETLARHAAGAISRIQREALLRAQATRDPLTGLHNRRFLEEALALEETRAKRRNTPIGLMVLDVDHFKRFNDSFGHDAGDALLRALGRAIRSQVRKGDIPCRFGGEEFVIVLPEADLDITFARAEALREAVRALQVTHNGQALGPVTLSIGVACYPRHGANCQAVLKVADQALYAGKHAGRNRVMRPAPMLVAT